MANKKQNVEQELINFYLKRSRKTKKEMTTNALDYEDALGATMLRFLEKKETEEIENSEHFLNKTFSGYKRTRARNEIKREQYIRFKDEPSCNIDPISGQVTEKTGKIDGNYKEIIEHVFDKLVKVQQKQIFTLYYVKNMSQARIAEILSLSEATVSRKVAQLTVKIEKICPDLMCDADIVLSSIDIGNSRQGDVPQTYEKETTDAGECVKIDKSVYRPQNQTPRYPAVWNKLKTVGTMPLVTPWFTLPGSKETVSTGALLSGKKDLMKKHEKYRYVRFADLSATHPVNQLFKRSVSWEAQKMFFDMKPTKTVSVDDDTKSFQNVILIKTGTNGHQLSMF